MKTIRVLVVDDSAFMRHTITRQLSEAPGIEVVGTARDGVEALQRVAELRPDVVTLDVEMPRMDGLEALRRLMVSHPVPVVMVSTLTREGADTTIRALELGAVDFVTKPSGATSLDFYRVKDALVAAIVRASASQVMAKPHRVLPVVAKSMPATAKAHAGTEIVIIGCSTGGPRALQHVIPALPSDFPVPLLVVQHMPPGFTASLAARLDHSSLLTVREAADGDELRPGLVLVAPGGRHLVVHAKGRVALSDDPPEHGVRPSVDVTLRSVAQVYGRRSVSVVLTGMGSDGAQGAEMIRQMGGHVIVEDESTCVVFGMPRSVKERGGADQSIPLPAMARAIAGAVSRGVANAA